MDDREAAVAGLPHGPGDVLRMDRDGEGDHVDPRGHDLPDVHVAQVGQRFGDQPLLLAGGRALVPGRAFPRRAPSPARATQPPAPRAAVWWRAVRTSSGHVRPASVRRRRRRRSPARRPPDQHRYRLVGVVGVGAAVQQRGGGPPQPQRVERLDQPPFGARAAGQEDVGPAVEQHQDRDVVDVEVGLLEAELQADGHAAHVAHLHVDDDEVRRLIESVQHLDDCRDPTPPRALRRRGPRSPPPLRGGRWGRRWRPGWCARAEVTRRRPPSPGVSSACVRRRERGRTGGRPPPPGRRGRGRRDRSSGTCPTGEGATRPARSP